MWVAYEGPLRTRGGWPRDVVPPQSESPLRKPAEGGLASEIPEDCSRYGGLVQIELLMLNATALAF